MNVNAKAPSRLQRAITEQPLDGPGHLPAVHMGEDGIGHDEIEGVFAARESPRRRPGRVEFDVVTIVEIQCALGKSRRPRRCRRRRRRCTSILLVVDDRLGRS